MPIRGNSDVPPEGKTGGSFAEGRWEGLRDGLERAWGELNRASRETASRFR